jgi:selenocysteine-specific elongation factor
VRVRLESPAVLTRGDRFILRAYSPPITIAGGLVLDPQPPRGGTRTAAARARFAQLDPGRRPLDAPALLDATLTQMLEERGGQGLATGELVSRIGVAPAGVAGIVSRVVASGAAVTAGEVLVDRRAVEALEQQLLSAVGEHHREDPISDGLPREEARERVFSRAHPSLFDVVLGRLGASGRLVDRERLALPTHRVTLSPEHSDALGRVERAFREAGLRPPDVATLSASTGVPPDQVDQSIKLLSRQKRLAKVDALWFHADALAQLKQEIAALKQGSAPATVDVATFKERYGITRKYAIPLLEFLDRERVTRRVGEARVVL